MDHIFHFSVLINFPVPMIEIILYIVKDLEDFNKLKSSETWKVS